MRNKCLVWGTVLLIWGVVIVATLWIKGYQHQSSRRFTDEEIVRTAVHRAMQRMLVSPPQFIPCINLEEPEGKLFEPAIIVPYRDVDHFLQENPNCCQVTKNYRAKYVDVYGKVFFRDKSGQIHSSDSCRDASGKILYRHNQATDKHSPLLVDEIYLGRQYFRNKISCLP